MNSSFRKWIVALCVAAGAVACSDDAISPAPLVAPNLGTCTNLQVPGNVQIATRTFATGVQIYRWDGGLWVLMSPSAVLTSDSAHTRTVGVHYQGPTWEGLDGSKVTATAAANCTPDAGSIAWLLLNATATSAPGVFNGVTHIHRVNTVGGRPPATAGASVGALVSVAYTTEYFFYKPVAQ